MEENAIKSKMSKQKKIALSAIVVSLICFISLVSIFIGLRLQKAALTKKINQAEEELRSVLNQGEKLKDDEFYQLYYYDGSDKIISSGDKIIIDFGK